MVVFVAVLLLGTMASAQQIPSWKITEFEKHLAESEGEVLVVNFWATFCKPCIAEIPHFISITEKYRGRGVRLQLISLDMPSQYPMKLTAFVKKHAYRVPVSWLNETDADYFCPKVDPSWSGSIPATLIVNKKTGYRVFFEEEMTSKQFDRELMKAMGDQ